MMDPLVFTLPLPPNLTNNGGRNSTHWRIHYRERKDYLAKLDVLLMMKKLPPVPPAPFPRVTVRSVMYLGGAMDDDNAMARHKVCLDFLKKRGYIVDDRRSCLRWEGLPEQIVKRNGDYKIILTVTPVALEAAA